MKTNKSDIQEVMEQIVSFTQERDWDQFHNGKDLALALSIAVSYTHLTLPTTHIV